MPYHRKKYVQLLNNETVRKWYENAARSSPITAEAMLRALGHMCERFNTTPEKIAGMSENEAYSFLLDMVSALTSDGLTGSSVATMVKDIRSWLTFNGVSVKRRVNVPNSQDTPRLRNERAPTAEELRKIFLAGDEKARVACAIMAHSGVRPEVLGNYHGTDGLKVRDFPEMEIKDGKVSFRKVPTMIVVRASLSKSRRQYFTFLTQEGGDYLASYIEKRVREGESIGPESAIITPKYAEKPHIRTINIGDAVRGTIRKAGFPWRPYVLRVYFDTQMMLAESKGLIIRDYRSFFMGHVGDIENRYTTNKHRLPESIIEDMRESYAKSSKYLVTTAAEPHEDPKAFFRKSVLLAVGYTEDELEKMDLDGIDDKKMQQMIRDKLAGMMSMNGHKQVVVKVDEVQKFIESGYEFVAALPNNTAIMKLPF
ncbi:MAG: site-specific integrase [Nitrososphaerota archaeon]|jgi:hypothetical protein|nr:site-specific integrase [Nitrososphaerota archaeon]MDG6932923.1 site-specific integrase [Nitrososphaerota archaeon]MDG6935475.1 site-specific integrase [Nitrososphaerota archaeon]MDG6943608.1 site-specific integrase [Nitrososphaerota archaeon]